MKKLSAISFLFFLLLVSTTSKVQAIMVSRSLFGGVSDLDQDGLSNSLEQVLLTSPLAADSDGDGFNDAEEIARQSDPRDADYPSNNDDNASMGLVAQQLSNAVQLTTLVYLPPGTLNDYTVRQARLTGYQLHWLTNSYPNPQSQVARRQSVVAGATILIITSALSPAEFVDLQLTGSLAFGVKLVQQGVTTAYETTRFIYQQGWVMQMVRIFSLGLGIQSNNDCHQKVCRATPPTPQLLTGGGGIIYRPLAGSQEPPKDWLSGQVCIQSTSPVGSVGGSIIHEVNSADCQDMDTYCSSSSCAAAAGTTVPMIDWEALIGG